MQAIKKPRVVRGASFAFGFLCQVKRPRLRSKVKIEKCVLFKGIHSIEIVSGVFYTVNNVFECLRVVDHEITEDFAIECDVGFLELIHEDTV